VHRAARPRARTCSTVHLRPLCSPPAVFSARRVERLSARRLDVVARWSAWEPRCVPGVDTRAFWLLWSSTSPASPRAGAPSCGADLSRGYGARALHSADYGVRGVYCRVMDDVGDVFASTLHIVALNLMSRSNSHPLACISLRDQFATPRLIGFLRLLTRMRVINRFDIAYHR
jgi:hypothetical protein